MHRAFLVFTQELFEFFICLFGCASFYYSHAIHHTMDMCIDTDKGHIVEMREDDLCCLHADSWQRADGFESMGDFSAVYARELFCSHEEMLRFHAIIVHTSEHDFDFLWLELEEICGSFHEFEKPFCGFIHSFIRHLSGEYHSHEELKWRLEIELYEFRRIEFENFDEYLISLGFCTELHGGIVFNFFSFDTFGSKSIQNYLRGKNSDCFHLSVPYSWVLNSLPLKNPFLISCFSCFYDFFRENHCKISVGML